MKYCSTKKEARHDAAMHAVLGLNIPVGKRPWSMSCVASALKFHHNVILDCAALIFQIKVKRPCMVNGKISSEPTVETLKFVSLLLT